MHGMGYPRLPHLRMTRLWLAFSCLFAMTFSVHSAEAEPLSFKSGGKNIRIHAFRSFTHEAPAILVLHGAGGVDAGNRYVSQLARAVAENGYHTYLVEYFDRTGTSYASEPVIRAKFGEWVETIHDAVTFIARQPGVQPKRIGTFGYSLGGYLAVAHAGRDERVRATVELAGGIDSGIASTIKRLPPVLIIHGREDQRVPFSRAVELERFINQLGSRVETQFYDNERHILTPVAALSAMARSLQFFQEHMK
jgi:dienelactone hydrolase